MRGVTRRAMWGFLIGVLVCVAYWLSGFIPREIWYNSWAGSVAISLHAWLWPFGIFTIGPRSEQYVLLFYIVNGLTYAILSAALFVLRFRPAAYLSVIAATLTFLSWLDGLWDAHSWISFALVLVFLFVLAWHDLRIGSRPPTVPQA